MSLTPACFFHPITVLFLDDDKNFLTSIEIEFIKRKGVIFCSDCSEAMSLINVAQENINDNILKTLDRSEVDTETDHLVDLEINKLHKIIYSRSRFDYIAVLVIDYKMPGVNGIEFCRHLKQAHLGKIMLTAEADKDTAIDAFNQRLIDKFLVKKNKNLYEELVSSIEELKQNYFSKLSQMIFESLGRSFKALLLSDEFQKIFQKIQKESRSVEYYLVDSHGSFLFLDDKANPTWLIIRSDKEINEQIAVLEGLGASSSIIDQLTRREKLLFMFSEQDYKRPLNQWSEFLLDVSKLMIGYYYSVYEGKLTGAIEWEKVSGYGS